MRILEARERGETGLSQITPERPRETIVFEETVYPYTDESLPFEDYLKLFNTSQSMLEANQS